MTAPDELQVVSAPPRVLVLGPVEVSGADGRVEESKRARLTELLAFLALHPGASARQIDEAVWPERAAEGNLNTRNTATSKARAWLGRDADGGDYLPRMAAGSGYGLVGVETDWEVWQRLVPGPVENAGTEDLVQALSLVRGRPFEGAHPRRYGWADELRAEMCIAVVGAAVELAARRLEAQDWAGVEAAVVVGLRVEPAWESLWRLRIAAAYWSGAQAATREAVTRCLTLTRRLGLDIEPETRKLLAEIGSRSPGIVRGLS